MQSSSLVHCLLLTSLLLVLIPSSYGANILFFFGLSTYSHRITAWPLAVQLAEQGHSVTFLQPVVNKNPHPKVKDMFPKNVTHLPPPNLFDLRLKFGRLIASVIVYMLPTVGAEMCAQFVHNEDNLAWVNSNKFDVVVVDALFNDCGYGLAHKWGAKTVVFGTTHVFEWFPDSFGFGDESWYIPSVHYAQEMPLGFLGRLQGQLSWLYGYFNKEARGLPALDGMLRDKLKMPEMPSVSELVRNTSLILLNTHFSEELPRALPPNVVPVGGMHVSEKVNPLPEDMEKFIKGSGSNGFIYISFGSEADMTTAPKELRDKFFNAIAKSKARFLWRWSGERPGDMPDNVLTAKWMPQQDVLGHPKCRGFITHAGLLSMQESVMYGVPMIAFPIFAEQDYNAERLHRTGRGIRLDIATLTQAELESAIHRILTDPRIKEEMSLASKRFKDRPAKAVDTAVWWVEYILRHPDTGFFRSMASQLRWYERRQLDVWAFIGLTLLAFVYITLKISCRILSFYFGGKRKVTPSVSKTKKSK